jgi:ABC-type bacteriocin/lantibiotic exporter with double-glycine peptidase domain
VLLSFDTDVAEAELRALCDCTVFGTSAVEAVEAVRRLGFAQTAKYNLTAAELEACVGQGMLPIVFVNTLPIDGVKAEHALVVIGVSETEVDVYDPLTGERELPRHTFDAARATLRNLTILVRQ